MKRGSVVVHCPLLTFSQLNPMVGAVFVYCPYLSLYRMVVLPLLSSPIMTQWWPPLLPRLTSEDTSDSLPMFAPMLEPCSSPLSQLLPCRRAPLSQLAHSSGPRAQLLQPAHSCNVFLLHTGRFAPAARPRAHTRSPPRPNKY